MKIVFATQNRGKLAELRALVAGLPIEVATVPPEWHVDEPYATFEENAAHKARSAAAATGQWALADDSGLEVDALGGAPGVRSARYAGEPKNDAANNQKLLAALTGVPDEKRTARFRCVLALASPTGEVKTAAGVCAGRIGHAPRGSHGFGYDPLFLVDERTMAELPEAEKNRISHRARALAALRPILERLTG